jgi:trimeric autotransporter adhesin
MPIANARFILKSNSVFGAIPLANQLEVAELAINSNTGNLYTKLANSTVVLVGGGGGSSGGGGGGGNANVFATSTATLANNIVIFRDTSGELIYDSGHQLTEYAPNSAFTAANNASLSAGAAFDKANSATTTAAAAFGKANTACTQSDQSGTNANNAYSRANSAYDLANNAYITANTAYVHANNAYEQANTALTTSQGAFGQANSATTSASSAFGQANNARTDANTASDRANTAYGASNNVLVTAQAAFGKANTACTQSDTAGSQANIAYTQANLAFNQANSAYNQANTSNNVTVLKGAVHVGARTKLNIIEGTDMSITITDGGASDMINISFAAVSGGPGSDPTAAYNQANAARDQANTAYNQANNAYVSSNNVLITAQAAFGQANAARGDANTAYTQGNNAYNFANTVLVTTQAAFDKANTACTQSDQAGVQANNAYGAANSAASEAAIARNTVNNAANVTITNVFTANQTIRVTDEANTSVSNVLTLSHIITSNVPAVGTGLAIRFEQETSPGNNRIIAAIEAVANVVTTDAEFGDLVFKTISAGDGQNETLRLKGDSNRIIIGTANGNYYSDLQTEDNLLLTPRIQVAGTIQSNATLLLARFADTATGSRLILAKSRGTNTANFTIVQAGDVLGSISFSGTDSLDFDPGAAIRAITEGTPTIDRIAAGLSFMTTANGTVAAIPAERLHIANNGSIYTQGASILGQGPGTIHAQRLFANNLDVIQHTNNAYAFANTLPATIATTYAAANTASDRANTAYGASNTVLVTAQSAFGKANIACTQSDAAGTQANAAFDKANVANNMRVLKNATAVGARESLNFVEGSGITLSIVDGGSGPGMINVTIAASAGGGNVTSFAPTQTDNIAAYLGTDGLTIKDTSVKIGRIAEVSDKANTACTQSDVAGTQANNAYGFANTLPATIATAYAAANTASDRANTAYGAANTVLITAQAAFDKANTACTQADQAGTNANTAYNQANTAYNQANTGYGQANTAYNKANVVYASAMHFLCGGI